MSNCEKCSRDGWQSIGRCPALGSAKCPYEKKDYTNSKIRSQGGILLILGLLYLYVLVEYPFIWLQDQDTAFFGVTFRMGALSLAVFIGVIISCAGFCMLATSKRGLVSHSLGQSWIGWILNPYKIEYRTQIMEQREIVEPIADESSAPSIARIEELGLDETTAAVLASILHLVDLGAVTLAVMQTHESSGKELHNMVDDSTLILCPSGKLELPELSKFEQTLLLLVKDWPKRTQVFNSPLGPRLGSVNWIVKTEGLFNKNEKISIEDKQRVLIWQERYRKLFTLILEELELDKRGFANHDRDTVPLLSRVSFKQLRIALVTAILIFFTLGRFGVHVDRVSKVPELWDDLNSSHSKKQLSALDSLHAHKKAGTWAESGGRWLDRITQLVGSSSETIKFKALQAIALLDPQRISKWYLKYEDDILEALSSGSESIKIAALRTLQTFGAAASPAFAHVSKLLGPHVSEAVRVEAIKTISSLGLEPDLIVPIIAQNVGSNDVAVALSAIEVLGNLGPDAHGSIPALTSQLAHPVLGPKAAEALGKMSPYAKAAIPELKIAAKEGGAELSYYATKALEQLSR